MSARAPPDTAARRKKTPTNGSGFFSEYAREGFVVFRAIGAKNNKRASNVGASFNKKREKKRQVGGRAFPAFFFLFFYRIVLSGWVVSCDSDSGGRAGFPAGTDFASRGGGRGVGVVVQRRRRRQRADAVWAACGGMVRLSPVWGAFRGRGYHSPTTRRGVVGRLGAGAGGVERSPVASEERMTGTFIGGGRSDERRRGRRRSAAGVGRGAPEESGERGKGKRDGRGFAPELSVAIPPLRQIPPPPRMPLGASPRRNFGFGKWSLVGHPVRHVPRWTIPLRCRQNEKIFFVVASVALLSFLFASVGRRLRRRRQKTTGGFLPLVREAHRYNFFFLRVGRGGGFERKLRLTMAIVC